RVRTPMPRGGSGVCSKSFSFVLWARFFVRVLAQGLGERLYVNGACLTRLKTFLNAPGRIWTQPPAISRDEWSAGLRRLRPGISGGVFAERAGPEASAPVAVSTLTLHKIPMTTFCCICNK